MGNLILAVLLACGAIASSAGKAMDCASLHDCVYGSRPRITDFELTARVTFVRAGPSMRAAVALEDATGAAVAYADSDDVLPAVGDLVAIRGKTRRHETKRIIASYDHLSILPATNLQSINRLIEKSINSYPPADIASGKADCRPVTISGTVRDAIVPETNIHWLMLALLCDGEIIYVSLPNRDTDAIVPSDLIGAHLTATGLCLPHGLGWHNCAGRIVFLSDASALMVSSPPPDDFAAVPDLHAAEGMTPMDIARLGLHRLSGQVLAVWNGNCMLVRTHGDKCANVRLIAAVTPSCGDQVEVIGFPESDLYQINLTNARWHPQLSKPANPTIHNSSFVLHDSLSAFNSGRINAAYQGKVIRLRGTVLSLPASADSRLLLDCNGVPVAVDFSAQPQLLAGLAIGSQIDVCGTCVLEFDTTVAPMIIPRAKGFFVVVRMPDDLQIIAHPSWWTARRLTIATAALVLVLLGILLWNLSLRRQAERRGRELLQEQIEGVKSRLKFEERTRLAVELHDSIAQTLTGISMELAAAHTELAASMVRSCHRDLRNCLWDLRSHTLEETDMTKAVLNTLKPHVNDSRLAVRFCVPRSCLTDSTTHDLLCIIRELVVNAIRHGGATSIKVAGSVDNGRVFCSVIDNGCGFNPAQRPGVAEGHFGLQGIVERIHKLHGSFTLESTPGHGCKAKLEISTDHE